MKINGRFHSALLAAAATICAAALPDVASGAVAFRASSCQGAASFFGAPVAPQSAAKPAGTQPGDLMIFTASSTGASPPTVPSGWTQIGDSGSTFVAYKIAGPAEPANYSYYLSPLPFANVIGTIASFSGVDPLKPFAGTTYPAVSGTGTSVALPAHTGTRPGSLRFSPLFVGAQRTITFSSMSESCEHQVGSMTVSGGYEATGAGPVQTRTATLASSGAYYGQTFVLQPPSACAGGSLSLTPPPAVSFPPTALTGADQTVDASTSLRVNDLTGLGLGWSLSITSTPFISGIHSLPLNAVTATAVTPSAAAGNCSLPLNTVPAMQPLPAAPIPPAAHKIFNAAAGTGEGPTDLAVDFALRIPANARTGNYSSLWTMTLAVGP